MIGDVKAEKAKGATDAQVASARDYQRKGQFMIDFVMSKNSMGFHAPQEATRILGDAINFCRLGQLSLHGGPPPSHHPPNIENITSESTSTVNPSKEAKKGKKAGCHRPIAKTLVSGLPAALSMRAPTVRLGCRYGVTSYTAPAGSL